MRRLVLSSVALVGEGAGMAAETIKCGSIDVPHNTKRWEVMTNRHTSTRGFPWGWIDGPDHNVCWSNDPGKTFTSKDAARVVDEHNAWLKEQTPIALRIIEQRKNAARLRDARDNAMARYQAAGHAYTEAMVALMQLELQAGNISKEPAP